MNREKYILAIDQGTTSTRVFLFDKSGEIIKKASRPVDLIYKHPGWVEVDAVKIYLSVIDGINEVLVTTSLTMDDIDSIGITNQRETTVVWDKNTSMPIADAIVWQSRQTVDICNKFEDKRDLIFKKTGLLLNPYFSASKIIYILDNTPESRIKAENGELMFGTIDSWIIYKLSKGEHHFSDVSNASRTMLYNIFDKCWDKELLELFNIPLSMMPEVKASSDDFGVATFLSDNVHIYGVCGDQQSALFGHSCFKKGESKNTYGTGCFMLMNIGETPVLSKKGLLTTIAWEVNHKTYYALEGSVFVGGALIEWLKNGLKIVEHAKETDEIARSVVSSDGLYIVPAFVGLGTPYWDDEARGAMFGITRGTTKAHLIRASLEAIAYQCKDVISTMEEECSTKITTLKVDGGASKNNLLMQFQSDILNCEVITPACFETTAQGVSFLAGLYSGFYKDIDSLCNMHKFDKVYTPSRDQKEVDYLYEGWKKAIEATIKYKR